MAPPVPLYDLGHLEGEDGRVNRRSFLAGGIRVTTLAVAGAVVDAAVETSGGLKRHRPAVDAGSEAPLPRTALTTTGVTNPVGVDPDEVLFAWQESDRRRGAVQSGYRIVVTGPGEGPDGVGLGPVASAARPSWPTAVRRWPPTPATTGRCARPTPAGPWSEPSARATFTTGLRTADWTALWLRPGPADPGEEEYTYLRTTEPLPAGTVAYATAYVAAAHKYQLWVNGARVDTGPSFCFPDEQYYQATDVTSALVAGRANAIGLLHHWYGPGRGRPTSAPGLLVQVVVHYTDGSVVTIASDGAWRTRPAEWLPAPQRNNDSGDFVEWIDGRLPPTGWSDAGFDDRAWAPAAVLGPVGTAPFTDLYAQRTRITEHRCRQRRSAPWPPARWWSTSARSTPAGPPCRSTTGPPVTSCPCTSATPSTPTGRSPPPTTPRAPISPSPTPSAPVPRPSTPTGTSASATCRSTIPARPSGGPGHPHRPPRHHARRGAGHLHLVRSHARRGVGAVCPLRPLHLPGAVHRHPDPGEGPVPVGRRQRVPDGHAHLRRAEPELAGTAGHGPGPGPLLAHHRAGERGLPQRRRAQDYPTFTALYPEWVWRYYLSTGDRATVVGLLPTLSRLSDYLAGIVDTSPGSSPGSPCRPTATTSTATTTTPTPTRR